MPFGVDVVWQQLLTATVRVVLNDHETLSEYESYYWKFETQTVH